FYAKASGYTLWLAKDSLVFERHQRDVSRLVFLGANPDSKPVPAEAADYKVHYLTGNDPAAWRTDIPTSRSVLFEEIYKNIDLKLYGTEREIEYDFIVKPGGKVADIAFAYRDVQRTALDDAGDLVVDMEFGGLRHKKPSCYQMIQGERKEVDGRFKPMGDNRYSFEVSGYDDSHELIIDPVVLAYSTFLGGTKHECGYGLALDNSGAAYLIGSTSSTDFPTKKPFSGKRNGSSDVFLTKISATGASLIYSTYIGGSSWEVGSGVAVDAANAAYLVGYTDSKDFPTQNPIQKDRVWFTDVFVAKINKAGNALVYSTYLGGWGFDYGHGIAVDKAGSAYVTGTTGSNDFPVKNPIYKYQGGYWGDAFVSKLSQDGGSLVYSTFLGGSGNEHETAIAVDSQGAAYVVGGTESNNFPVKNPYQAVKSKYVDAFITKIHPKGTSLVYSTFLGGKGGEYCHDIAVDKKGAAYITGETTSKDFPLKNAMYPVYKGGGLWLWEDAFITKIHPKGNTLVFSTYLGGTGLDEGYCIALDGGGNIYVSGATKSTDFPVKNAFQDHFNGGEAGDAFVAKIKPNGKTMVYATYLGGAESDGPFDMAINKNAVVHLIGYTRSADFPTKRPLYKEKSGEQDVFFAKLK
ncbi:MAG: SBBP repeat-containing protein, partial [Deltaproteobacteria bacterium]|nr:SBBP repeat-containing protein [Deltaproteobacteria bacterium]